MTRVPGEETRPIHWRMPKSQYEAVAQEAQKRGVPLSQIYREAMSTWMMLGPAVIPFRRDDMPLLRAP